MLISRRDGALHLVTQPDHARLCGRLSEQWGNEGFARGPRHASLTIAAARHDDGWAALDAAPFVAEDEGRPAHFLEVPLPATVGPYGEAVARVYDHDAYAGVLGSRHWAGLYSARWGLVEVPPADHPLAVATVAEQELVVARHLGELWAGDGLRGDFEAELWRDYERLQALDLLSLALCLIDTERPTPPAVADIPVAATLRDIDQPEGGRLVASVPGANGRRLTLRMSVVEPHVVAIDPFPLAQSGATVEIPLRRIADERHASAQAATAAYREAPAEAVTVALVAA